MEFSQLCDRIRACEQCKAILPLGANPVFRASPQAKILIAGQAPGIRVHESSIPFNDPSGKRLRQWMDIDEEMFYDETKIAIIPMGFCYPGTGKNGDLPPTPQCQASWHPLLLPKLTAIRLILPIGIYAHQYHLAGQRKKNLTETVKHWRDYAPKAIPLPHPSPRNNRWLKNNPWFETETLPFLKRAVKAALFDDK